MGPGKLASWLGLLGLVVFVDSAHQRWAPPVATIIKGIRPGWFDSVNPFEGDRPPRPALSHLVAISPSGIKFQFVPLQVSGVADALTAYSPDERTLWSQPIHDLRAILPSTAVVYLTDHWRLRALDETTGEELWSVVTDESDGGEQSCR